MESRAARQQRAGRILCLLRAAYPDARCELDYATPLELLVAVQLSAQCTDRRVNEVTPNLFARYHSAADWANAEPSELEEAIRSTGFFRNKARNLIAMGAALCARHQGRVPGTLDELVKLPGVGRKTANVILINAFNTPGIAVDTHCLRVSRRLGLTRHSDPVKVEFDLQALLPERDWAAWSHAVIFHGRRCCRARRPDCPHCPVAPRCPAAAC